MKNENKRIADEEEYYSLTKKVWNVLAPYYDVIILPFSRIRDKVVSFTNAKYGTKILDVATGTGKQAFAFAKRGYDVTGVDLSEAMLKIAVKKNRYTNVKFQVADATHLPFADNSFDATCVSFALHDMPLTIMEKVLPEMVRITKPGGIIVVVDYGLPKNRFGRFFIFHFVKLYEKYYYSNFIKSDLGVLLRKSKIEIEAEMPAVCGAVRILKGVKKGEA